MHGSIPLSILYCLAVVAEEEDLTLDGGILPTSSFLSKIILALSALSFHIKFKNKLVYVHNNLVGILIGIMFNL